MIVQKRWYDDKISIWWDSISNVLIEPTLIIRPYFDEEMEHGQTKREMIFSIFGRLCTTTITELWGIIIQ